MLIISESVVSCKTKLEIILYKQDFWQIIRTFRAICSVDGLQEQVQRQCQQRIVSILLAVSGHQKQQQDYQQILRIEIARKQLTQKISDAHWRGGLFSYLGTAAVPGRRRTVVITGSGRAAACAG